MGRKMKDLKGDPPYGRLEVLRAVGTRHGKMYWECKCSCNNICVVSTTHLRNGHTASCGCLRDKVLGDRHLAWLDRKEAILRMLAGGKSRAEAAKELGISRQMISKILRRGNESS